MNTNCTYVYPAESFVHSIDNRRAFKNVCGNFYAESFMVSLRIAKKVDLKKNQFLAARTTPKLKSLISIEGRPLPSQMLAMLEPRML